MGGNSLQGSTILMFLLYLVFMMIVGVYFYRKTKKDDTLSGYLLGGRSLNPLVAAISAGDSDMSGWLLMGLPVPLMLPVYQPVGLAWSGHRDLV